MLNECVVCAGAVRDLGYMAPEARCTCEKVKKIREDKKHDMLVAEARWLTACGWQATDIKAKSEGFLWQDQTGEGSFTQARAVDIQKFIDSHPHHQRDMDIRVRYARMKTEMERRQKAGQPVASIQADMQRLLDAIIEDPSHAATQTASPVPPHR